MLLSASRRLSYRADMRQYIGVMEEGLAESSPLLVIVLGINNVWGLLEAPPGRRPQEH